ncbi:MAG: adenosine kinase [Spirochaetota bacterium]|nr:adenosine kinase [Spirochaetota bacterium]
MESISGNDAKNHPNVQESESNSGKADYDVVGIGSPLLDFTIEVDKAVLDEIGLKRGQMHLVDENRSMQILQRLNGYPMKTTPGGSSANTLAGIANFGGRCILFGKVGNDTHGELYIRENEKAGVRTRLNKHEAMTGHAITLITPDSERTFATHLGAAIHFVKEDVFEDDIKGSKILHIEGYLLELPEVREAVVHAMRIAKENNVIISIDLGDASLVDRIKDVFNSIVDEFADIVFVNEDEAKAFTGVEEKEALDMIYSMCDIAVVKLGADGSMIKRDNKIYNISANRVGVVNTNGAGDMYAAGILYGVANDLPIDRAGRIASYASSLVVSQVSARLNNKVNIDQIE